MSDSTSENTYKNKYYGIFNWKGEIHDFWCWADSEDQAFLFFCIRLAEKLWRIRSFDVRHYFYDSNKYEIRKEVIKDGGDEKADEKANEGC